MGHGHGPGGRFCPSRLCKVKMMIMMRVIERDRTSITIDDDVRKPSVGNKVMSFDLFVKRGATIISCSLSDICL